MKCHHEFSDIPAGSFTLLEAKENRMHPSLHFKIPLWDNWKCNVCGESGFTKVGRTIHFVLKHKNLLKKKRKKEVNIK